MKLGKKTKIGLAAALIVLGATAGWMVRQRQKGQGVSDGAAARRYYCPMHPDYTSDRPGTCPICNMNLVAAEEETAAPGMSGGGGPAGAAGSGRSMCLLHDCKMADCKMEMPAKPGERVSCPVCGEYVSQPDGTLAKVLYYRHPHKPEATSAAPRKDEMGMDYVPVYAEARAGAGTPGQAAITLSQERRQLIGMRTEAVAVRELSAVVRASGRVAYDPDLYNAVAEHRAAVKAREKVEGSSYPDVLERTEALVRASALRLRQLGLSQEQIAECGRTDEPPINLLVGGGGHGGAVWVYAQIYEFEIGLVRAGQAAEMTTPAYPGRKFRGVVKSLDPVLSSETRSLKARIEAQDPEGLLKLEMYVNTVIRAGLGRKLALPESALLDTGERKLVFVDLGEGRLEPRELSVGRQAEGYYEVLGGLREGERVVTSANFLIDSESRLKAALSGAGKKGKATDPHAGH